MTMTAPAALDFATQAPGPADPVVMDTIGGAATAALLQELAAWPKPGLVSHVDSGKPPRHGCGDVAGQCRGVAALFHGTGPCRTCAGGDGRPA